MIELGWIGSFCLAICGLPLAIEVFKSKNASHVNGLFLLLWTLGEIFTLAYVVYNRDYPLILNYLVNLLTLIVVIYYKLKPSGKIQPES
jgi:uncharacterized protein with PQ loop repeat